MLARDGVASRKNLRLHCARHVYEIHVAAARIRRRSKRFWGWLVAAPGAENLFDALQQFLRLEIADQQEQRVLWRVEFTVDGEQILSLVGGDLRFAGRN